MEMQYCQTVLLEYSSADGKTVDIDKCYHGMFDG
jgi:hypothetical protein